MGTASSVPPQALQSRPVCYAHKQGRLLCSQIYARSLLWTRYQFKAEEQRKSDALASDLPYYHHDALSSWRFADVV